MKINMLKFCFTVREPFAKIDTRNIALRSYSRIKDALDKSLRYSLRIKEVKIVIPFKSNEKGSCDRR